MGTLIVNQQLQKRNLLSHSEDIDTYFSKYGGFSATSTSEISPALTNNAQKFVFNEATANRYKYRDINFPSLGTFTFSVYLKSDTGTTVGLRANNNDFGGGTFDVKGVFALNSNWQRCHITFTTNVNTIEIAIDSRSIVIPGVSDSGEGVSDSGEYVAWGAQVNLGEIPITYQKTTN